MRLALATLPLFAGCDILFQLRDVKPAAPDAPVPLEASVDAAPRCPFSDTFDDGILSTAWQVINPEQNSGIVSEKNGMLDIALTTAFDDAYNGLSTATKHDLASKITRATIFPMYTGGWYELFFTIRLDGQNEVFMHTGAGAMSAYVTTDGVRSFERWNYDPAIHRHWQMRHDEVARLVHFEASGDGVVFETLRTAAVPWSFNAVDIMFVAGTFQLGGPPPGSARFDDLSVCPPAPP